MLLETDIWSPCTRKYSVSKLHSLTLYLDPFNMPHFLPKTILKHLMLHYSIFIYHHALHFLYLVSLPFLNICNYVWENISIFSKCANKARKSVDLYLSIHCAKRVDAHWHCWQSVHIIQVWSRRWIVYFCNYLASVL